MLSHTVLSKYGFQKVCESFVRFRTKIGPGVMEARECVRTEMARDRDRLSGTLTCEGKAVTDHFAIRSE